MSKETASRASHVTNLLRSFAMLEELKPHGDPMFTRYESIRRVKLAAVEHLHQASTIQLDHMDRLVRFYTGTATMALKALRSLDSATGLEPVSRLSIHVWKGHIHLADQAQEGCIQLLEAQTHRIGKLARQSLEEAVKFSPPLVEASISATEALVETGETVVESMGATSRRAIKAVDAKVRLRPRTNLNPAKRR